jgi:holo-[acyl-carrier protein] synthase
VRPWQSRYHGLIHAFKDLTNIPAVVNTSFNVAGEPIVLSQADAVNTFLRSDLDVLVMDDLVIRRPRATSRSHAGDLGRRALSFTPWAAQLSTERRVCGYAGPAQQIMFGRRAFRFGRPVSSLGLSMDHFAVRVGVDTVRVEDVLRSLGTFGRRYLDRVYTKHEQDSCHGPSDVRARALAARFAAKEAMIKILRPGPIAVPWTSVEVHRQSSGWCELRLTGSAAELARRSRLIDLSMSMTHDEGIATAVVVAVVLGDEAGGNPD